MSLEKVLEKIREDTLEGKVKWVKSKGLGLIRTEGFQMCPLEYLYQQATGSKERILPDVEECYQVLGLEEGERAVLLWAADADVERPTRKKLQIACGLLENTHEG